MKSLLFQVILLLFITACIQPKVKQSESGSGTKTKEFDPPKITVLENLADSLQPIVTYLDNVPLPVTTIFSIPPPAKTFIDSVTGHPIPPDAQGTGFFTNYTTEDGLCLDMVHSAFRDSNDQLWFGTMGGGVSRYDGESFTSFTTEHGLPSNTVWTIYEDRVGNMWFGTSDGLSRYNGRSFINFTTDQGLPGDDIGNILEDKSGRLWITILGHGFLRYDGKTFTNFTTEHGLTSNDVWCMTKDHEGKIWCGTRGGGIFYFNPQDETPTFSIFGNQEESLHDNIMCILEDQKGNMWFGTQQSGAVCFDGKTYKHYSQADGLGCNTVLKIKEDKQGTLWFGTCQGLCRFDNGTFVSYNANQGLTNKMINCIIDDKSGNIWMGTYGGGVFQYGGDAFVNFKSGPINNNVTAILQDKSGPLWFGTRYSGISLYDGKTITTFMPEQGLATNWISFMMQDKRGNIWFSPYYGGGAQRLDINLSTESFDSTGFASQRLNLANLKIKSKASLTTYTSSQGLAFDAVYGITEDKNGNLWFATYGGGISKFDGKSFTTFTASQGLASNNVFNIFEDSRGNFWVQYLNAEGITFFDGKAFLNFTTAHGLADNSVNSMTEDENGNLLFGTQKGISLLREAKAVEISTDKNYNKNIHGPFFETFTTNNGLPSNVVLEIISDQENNLLVVTSYGLAYLRGGLNAFSTGDIEIFGPNEGCPLTTPGIVFKDNQGIIWISTDSDNTGLVRFDPKSLHKNWDPPKVFLQSIKIDDEAINWYDLLPSLSQDGFPDRNTNSASFTEEMKIYGRQLTAEVRDSVEKNLTDIKFDSITSWYSIPLNLVLSYKHNKITFDFHSTITTNNHLVRYQYMLDGYDKRWSPMTDKSLATFGNMHEGYYTFKVKARSPEGVWSEPISYKFKVLPPIHRTWWAYSLYGVIFLSMIYTGHKFQKQRTIKTEQEKTKQKQAILNERLRISRDLHDEVGATLSGIVMYSHLAKGQVKEGKIQAEQSINIVQESASEMVDKLNDVVWLVNPEKDTLGKLMEKLEEYATQTTSVKNIDLSFSAPENLENFVLPIEFRKNIYLFCKEAINNAVKYSEGTQIEIIVTRSDHTLEFVIKDNGIGFDPQSVKRGNGLNNMQQRAEAISGEYSFLSNLGNTIITLKCKIPQLGYA